MMNHALIPAIPSPLHLWRSLLMWVGVAYVLLILRALPALIVELFPQADTTDFRGTLTATAEEGITATVVRLGGQPAAMLLPVAPLR